MDGAGHELLPGAALAPNENGRRAARDGSHETEDVLHLARRSHQVSAALLGLERRLQPPCPVDQPLALRGLLDHQGHRVRRGERLGQEVVCAVFYRLHRGVHVPEGSHHDHLHIRAEGLGAAEDFHSIDARQHEVQQQDVGGLLGEERHRLVTVIARCHVDSTHLEDAGERASQRRLVVHDQDAETLLPVVIDGAAVARRFRAGTFGRRRLRRDGDDAGRGDFAGSGGGANGLHDLRDPRSEVCPWICSPIDCGDSTPGS